MPSHRPVADEDWRNNDTQSPNAKKPMTIQDFLKSLSKHRLAAQSVLPSNPRTIDQHRPNKTTQSSAIAGDSCVIQPSNPLAVFEAPADRSNILRPLPIPSSCHSKSSKADGITDPMLEALEFESTCLNREGLLPEALADQQRSGSPIMSSQSSVQEDAFRNQDNHLPQSSPALSQSAANHGEGQKEEPSSESTIPKKPSKVRQITDGEDRPTLERQRGKRRLPVNELPLVSELPVHHCSDEVSLPT